MKSLSRLKEESLNIQSEISILLTDNYRFGYATKKQNDVMATLTALQQHLAMIQRELRERLLA
ncbi:MAG TPA: hypothetical protein VGI43_06555 [Mucilaginibacter sp.]|jgi:hypothetical protein